MYTTMSTIVEDMVNDVLSSNQTPEMIQNILNQIIDSNKEIYKKNNHEEEIKKQIKNGTYQPIMNEKSVQEDLTRAFENTPEFFTPINMLYIGCQINDIYITAFVDTGAQVSIMNLDTARRCNLLERIDTKNRGTVVGVGSQQSVGYVYHVDMMLGQYIIPCNFMILRTGPDIIIGLNIMKTHRISIDMGEGAIKIGGQKIQFLGSKDIIRSESFDLMKKSNEKK
jgi:DNA damage-inducible protein 1